MSKKKPTETRRIPRPADMTDERLESLMAPYMAEMRARGEKILGRELNDEIEARVKEANWTQEDMDEWNATPFSVRLKEMERSMRRFHPNRFLNLVGWGLYGLKFIVKSPMLIRRANSLKRR